MKMELSSNLTIGQRPEFISYIPDVPLAYMDYLRVYDKTSMYLTPIEEKSRCVSKSYRRKCLYTEYKPDSVDRDKINVRFLRVSRLEITFTKNEKKILEYTGAQELTLEEKDLIWKFRYYLSCNKNTLPIFIRCVAWQDEYEAEEALRLIGSWTGTTFDDVIEILSLTFKHKELHEVIVKMLQKASDEVYASMIMLYTLSKQI